MRICLDLDGVITQLRRGNQTYEEVLPVPGAIEAIREFRESGHEIIIYTARHMKTCLGNEGLVTARVAATTMSWLARYGVEFDEIHFGKPWADVYIDDNALRFQTWADLDLESYQSAEQLAHCQPTDSP